MASSKSVVSEGKSGTSAASSSNGQIVSNGVPSTSAVAATVGPSASAAGTSSESPEAIQAVGEEGRVLLELFVAERLRNDGIPLNEHDIQADRRGPPAENIRTLARYLKLIGDQLDTDEQLQMLIENAPRHAPKETFVNVAKEIFADGVFSWGRVVALFYFAYRLIRNICDELPYVREIMNWVTWFLTYYVAPWIVARGGWNAIREYVADTTPMQALPLCLGVAAIALMGLLRYLGSTK